MPDAIGGIGAAQSAGLHGSVDSAMSALGGLDSEGFLNLLVAQLRYQNPMEPSDPSALMNQTSQLAQLDATQQLLGLQQRELGMQQAVTAAGMLGTTVTATDADGQPVEGVVDQVRYTALGPVLGIGGVEFTLASISELRLGTTPVA